MQNCIASNYHLIITYYQFYHYCNNYHIKALNLPTEQAWDEYILHKHNVPAQDIRIRKHILQSWNRSKEKYPYNSPLQYISSTELSRKTKEYQSLISTIMKHIVHLQSQIQKNNLHPIFTDSSGIVLISISRKDTGTELPIIKPGAILSEDTVGTTAISISLAEDTAYYTSRYENYNKAFHQCVFYAVPLHTNSNRIDGVFCCISEDTYKPEILEALQYSANELEAEIQLRRMNILFQSSMNLIPQGVVVLNSQNKIIHANEPAKQIIAEDKDIIGKSVFDYVDKNSIPDILLTNDTIHQISLNLRDNAQETENLTVTKKHIHSLDSDDLDIILIQPEYQSYAQISQAVGFVATETFASIAGTSKLMKSCISSAKTIAKTDANVLIAGEIGVGKEIFAQAIHNASSRKNKPFITISCSTLPTTSLMAELTGTSASPSKLELAKGGTIFLDNIDTLSPDVQQLMFRLIHSSQNKYNVRIISSTTKNMQSLISNYSFNSNLFYELSILSLTIPPLRDHPSDIEGIVTQLLALNNSNIHYSFSPNALEAMKVYSWPGNIRELENAVQRIMAINDTGNIPISDLPKPIADYYFSKRYRNKVNADASLFSMMNELPPASVLSPDMKEYNLIIEALEKEKGNVQTAAVLLHMPASTLYRKIRKYNLRAKDFKHL